MNQYFKVLVATEKNVSEYLSKGWEIIDTTKTSYGLTGNDTDLNYHLGYPYKRYCEDLLSFLRMYEDKGFKEKLFYKIAEDGEVNLDDYTTNGGFFTEDNDVLNLIKNYESIVNGKNINYCKKIKSTDSNKEIFTIDVEIE